MDATSLSAFVLYLKKIKYTEVKLNTKRNTYNVKAMLEINFLAGGKYMQPGINGSSKTNISSRAESLA